MTSNKRQRELARAKYERQQERRSSETARRRRRQRILAIATVAVVASAVALYAAPLVPQSVFDMVVGAWIARDSVKLGLPWMLRTVALVLTFLAGPVGFLVHILGRAGLRRTGAVE